MTSKQWEALLVAGPTASGKSALALDIAERFGGLIVNADSMQVYRDLAVLSARPGPEETARAPHLLYGHIDGAVNYSVGLWRADAARALASARAQGRLPIVIGGTGLYFKALEQGLAEMPAVPEEVRRDIRARAAPLETPDLHAWLAGDDPETAAKLRPSDRQRLVRALEILAATGRPLSAWQKQPHSPPLLEAARCLRFFMSPERGWLYERIDRRFDIMMASGALDEVRRLAARRLDPALPVMRAHGVPGFLAHLSGGIGLEEAVMRGKADTRHYAKRQFTWFRHQMPGWKFVSPEKAGEAMEAALKGGPQDSACDRPPDMNEI